MKDQGPFMKIQRINGHSWRYRGSRAIFADIEDQGLFWRYRGSRAIFADIEDQGPVLKILSIKGHSCSYGGSSAINYDIYIYVRTNHSESGSGWFRILADIKDKGA